MNGYICSCMAGYTGLRCDVDIDDCASAPCIHGNCSVSIITSLMCTFLHIASLNKFTQASTVSCVCTYRILLMGTTVPVIMDGVGKVVNTTLTIVIPIHVNMKETAQ